jgi:hypothetical protein
MSDTLINLGWLRLLPERLEKKKVTAQWCCGQSHNSAVDDCIAVVEDLIESMEEAKESK